MTHILHIDASGRHDGSFSRQLSAMLVDTLKAKDETTVTYRDVSQGMIFPDDVFISGLYLKDEERTTEQKQSLAFSDALVKEVQDADIIVIGTPIYNFGVPGCLKAWADQVARAGVTFTYTDQGPKGLLDNKKAYVTVASGGVKMDSPADFATPWLRFFLGFIGIHDVEAIGVNGVKQESDPRFIEAKEQAVALAA